MPATPLDYPVPVELLSVEADITFGNPSDPKINPSFPTKGLSWHFVSTCLATNDSKEEKKY